MLFEGTDNDDVIQTGIRSDIVYAGDGDDLINPGLRRESFRILENPGTEYEFNSWGYRYFGHGIDQRRYHEVGDFEVVYSDEIYAGAGDDTMYFTFDYDSSYYGGSGNDQFIYPKEKYIADVYYSGSHTSYGGDGADTLNISRWESDLEAALQREFTGGTYDVEVNINLEDGTVESDGDANFVNLRSGIEYNRSETTRLYIDGVENIIATRYDDNITGDAENNVLDARGGDDDIYGAGGHDKLRGGSGNGTLTDGVGKDNLFGGDGADVFVLVDDDMVDSIKDFQDGQDIIDVSALGVTSFQDFDVSVHRSGKILLEFEDDLIAVQGRNLSRSDLGDEDFIFA